MGYFDYLDEKTQTQREFQSFDIWAKAGAFVGLGSLIISLVALFVFLFAVPIGSSIWLDILVGVGLAVGITGVTLSAKAIKMAKNIRKVTEIGRFALIWGIFVILVDLAMITANTWMYFS